MLAGRGLLAPTDLVTDHLRELSGSAWEGCRIQDILDMRVGIAWDFDVDEYTIIDVSDYRTHDRAGEIPADTETWIRTVGRGPYGHGEGPFRYCSLASDVLGWLLSRVGGAPFPELFSREVWSRIGAEHDAAIMLDHAGFAIVEGGICTTLRDLARFGLLCLEDGRIDGEQVVPADWITRVCVRDAGLHRGVPRIGHGRPDAARRLLPRQVVGVRRAERRLHGPRHERAGDPRPPAVADGDREVLDVRRRARLGRLRPPPRGDDRPLRAPRRREMTDKRGRTSAGILLWRTGADGVEVLLAHQGGPYWVKKDLGHWTVPKGEIEPGEERVDVARREFLEETGHPVPAGPLVDLGEITQKSGKVVLAWAVRGDLDPSQAFSNTFDLEWPPRSGRIQSFPEIDRVEWFGLDEAARRLKAAQVPFLDRLRAVLADHRD